MKRYTPVHTQQVQCVWVVEIAALLTYTVHAAMTSVLRVFTSLHMHRLSV